MVLEWTLWKGAMCSGWREAMPSHLTAHQPQGNGIEHSNLPSWGGLPGWWLHSDSSSWAAPRSTRRHLWEFLHDCMWGREHVYILRSTSLPNTRAWLLLTPADSLLMHREFHLSFLVLKASVTMKEFPAASAMMPVIQTVAAREGRPRDTTRAFLPPSSLADKFIYCCLYFKGKSYTPWIFVLNCGYLLRTSTCFFQLNWFFQ